jgi:hypothetical protein
MTPRERFLREQYRWMMKAVTSKAHPDFERFGNVGITIDDAWRSSFDLFAKDLLSSLPRSLARRQLLLKPRARRFDVDSIEWGYQSKLVGVKLRTLEG